MPPPAPLAYVSFTALGLTLVLVLTLWPSHWFYFGQRAAGRVYIITCSTVSSLTYSLLTQCEWTQTVPSINYFAESRWGVGGGGDVEGVRAEREKTDIKKNVAWEAGVWVWPTDSGPIVVLGNDGTKETGGVHLILAGGKSLWSREHRCAHLSAPAFHLDAANCRWAFCLTNPGNQTCVQGRSRLLGGLLLWMLDFYGEIKCLATWCNLLSHRNTAHKRDQTLREDEGWGGWLIFVQGTVKQTAERRQRLYRTTVSP